MRVDIPGAVPTVQHVAALVHVFESTSLTADQRKRKLLNRDLDVLRQLIAVLSPAF